MYIHTYIHTYSSCISLSTCMHILSKVGVGMYCCRSKASSVVFSQFISLISNMETLIDLSNNMRQKPIQTFPCHICRSYLRVHKVCRFQKHYLFTNENKHIKRKMPSMCTTTPLNDRDSRHRMWKNHVGRVSKISRIQLNA